jgi:hypothetical protein
LLSEEQNINIDYNEDFIEEFNTATLGHIYEKYSKGTAVPNNDMCCIMGHHP